MDLRKLAKGFFLFDTGLNLVLGTALLAFPGWVDGAIGIARVLPELWYRLIGAGFLAFAIWQVFVNIRGEYHSKELLFAFYLAVLPILALTIGLVHFDLPLKPFWRVMLWFGNMYMFGLGVLYCMASKLMFTEEEG